MEGTLKFHCVVYGRGTSNEWESTVVCFLMHRQVLWGVCELFQCSLSSTGEEGRKVVLMGLLGDIRVCWCSDVCTPIHTSFSIDSWLHTVGCGMTRQHQFCRLSVVAQRIKQVPLIFDVLIYYLFRGTLELSCCVCEWWLCSVSAILPTSMSPFTVTVRYSIGS